LNANHISIEQIVLNAKAVDVLDNTYIQIDDGAGNDHLFYHYGGYNSNYNAQDGYIYQVQYILDQ
jgi:hypothetical protein